MTIDAHLHIWRALPDFPEPAATTVSPASDIPLALLEQYMDEFDVERAVLVQPMYYGDDNSYVADAACASPDRFAAVCVVDPRHAEAPGKLEYWVRQRGCRGLRLRPRMPSEAACFGSPETYPLWEKANDLNIAINVLGNVEHLKTVEQLAERFPAVRIIIDHFAHPDITPGSGDVQRLLQLARLPNIWIKISGFPYFSKADYPFLDCQDLVRAVAEHFGVDRMFWGSDFPHILLQTGYARSVHLLERGFPFLSKSDRTTVLSQNARQLYWDRFA